MYQDFITAPAGLMDVYPVSRGFAPFSLLEMFSLPLLVLFCFVLLAFVLYFFTGEKKRADEFMPSLLIVGMRIFSYAWMYIGMIVGFFAGVEALSTIFETFGGRRLAGEQLLPQIGAVLIAASIIFFMHRLVHAAEKVSNHESHYAKKIFLLGSLSTFSLFLVYSLFQFVIQFLSALASAKSVLNAQNVSMLLISTAVCGYLLFVIWKMLPMEKKK